MWEYEKRHRYRLYLIVNGDAADQKVNLNANMMMRVHKNQNNGRYAFLSGPSMNVEYFMATTRYNSA